MDISSKDLPEIPMQFGTVKGDFNGAPEYVNGVFDCTDNRLTTLEGIPKYIKRVLYCSGNNIPQDIIVQYQGMSLFVIIGDEDE